MMIPIIVVNKKLNSELAENIRTSNVDESLLENLFMETKENYIKGKAAKTKVNKLGVITFISLALLLIGAMFISGGSSKSTAVGMFGAVSLVIGFVGLIVCLIALMVVIIKSKGAAKYIPVYEQLVSCIKVGYPNFFDTHEEF